MSLNLHLGVPGGPTFGLRQTPTTVTMEANRTNDHKRVYFEWLDSCLVGLKPRAPGPRADRKLKDQYRRALHDYECEAQQDSLHKQGIERFLVEHPDARWGWG